MVFSPLHILIDLSEALVNIPKQEHSKTGCGSCLTIFFALEDPVLIIFLCQDEKIFTVGCIDEGINICESEILFGAINSLVLEAAVLEMALEDSIRVLRFHYVQISRE